jgi:hypothetical protein
VAAVDTFVRSNIDRCLLAISLIIGAVWTASSPIEASPTAYLGGAVGLVAIHERLRQEFTPSAALLTTLASFAGTTLFWSMTRTSSFADVAGFALAAAFLYLADRLRTGRFVVWCLVAVIPFAFRYVVGESGPPSNLVSSSLFSSTHGFLSLSPIVYLALIGLVATVRRHPVSTVGSVAILAMWVIGNSLLPAPATGEGPAAHRLTPALALLAPGLAELIERARRRPLAALIPIVIAGLAWNYWLMVQYTVGMVPKDAPISFGEMVRQQAEVHTGRPYVYPFAFPANVWFAWREGVPVDRYELLAWEPRRENVELAFDRAADRFLLEGWEARGSQEGEPVRWIGERRASLVVPFASSRDRATVISMMLRARLEAPPVIANLGLDVNGREIGRFSVPSDAAAEVRLTIPAEAVGRTFRAGYNRLTFVSYGVHRLDSPDQRASNQSGSGGGNRAWPVAIYRIRIAPE